GSQEVSALSQAVAQAWQTALDRLLEEAREVGADGVIGVQVVRSRHDWGEGVADVLAQGTAVRVERGDLPHGRGGRPFTCLCSPSAFWAMVTGGYRPLSVVAGHVVWALGHQTLTHALRVGHGQVELIGMTEGLYDARELALARMEAQAGSLAGADGVLGVRLVEEAHEWGPALFEFRAEGTAVARFADREPPRPEWVVVAE
ncbi:MAG: heavy metal-binding domain-containing protein, partial [Firmicutes bacterium]|nr:heavy metal-binding domain-containing protein [Bacillota bacterium]